MPPKPVRLRHPKGVSTIQVDFETFTVQDLQQEIYAATDILPSLQDLKSGYPPQTLTLIPELPLDSLGLKAGEQLIVNARPGAPTPTSGPITSPPPSQTLSAAPPVSRPPPQTAPPTSGPDFVETDGGALVHRIVPDDNACLFSSVALIFKQDISKAPEIRQLVASGISADPSGTYTPAILGRPVSEYIETILKPATWGGAIELAVLAAHFRTEICSVDVETGRVDHFTPPAAEANTGNRCIVLYSGIHYDAASLAPISDAPPDFHQTVFPIISESDSDPIIKAAKALADKLRAKRAYTNTSTFDLKCEICKQGLKGEKEARAHAAETGHTSFGEY